MQALRIGLAEAISASDKKGSGVLVWMNAGEKMLAIPGMVVDCIPTHVTNCALAMGFERIARSVRAPGGRR